MVLSNLGIRFLRWIGALKIIPFYIDSLQAATYDLHLDREIRVPEFSKEVKRIDLREISEIEKYYRVVYMEKEYEILPSQVILVITEERLTFPSFICGTVKARSTFGRLGLDTGDAGFVDPYFDGRIVFELKNNSSKPFVIWHGVSLAQIKFELVIPPAWKKLTKFHGQETISIKGIKE